MVGFSLVDSFMPKSILGHFLLEKYYGKATKGRTLYQHLNSTQILSDHLLPIKSVLPP